MALRHPINSLEGTVSYSTAMQDYYAVTMNEGNTGKFLEIGGFESETKLLDQLGWIGLSISPFYDTLPEDRTTNFVNSHPLACDLISEIQTIFGLTKKITTLIIDFDTDENTNEILNRLLNDIKFETIIIRKHGTSNQHRKTLHFKEYQSVAINLNNYEGHEYDWWCNPQEVKFSTMVKYAYDGVSVVDLINDTDLSSVTKRSDIWNEIQLETYWAQNFLQYE